MIRRLSRRPSSRRVHAFRRVYGVGLATVALLALTWPLAAQGPRTDGKAAVIPIEGVITDVLKGSVERRLEQARCVLCGHIHYPRRPDQAGKYNPLTVSLNFRGSNGWKLHQALTEQATKNSNTVEQEAMVYVVTCLRQLEEQI